MTTVPRNPLPALSTPKTTLNQPRVQQALSRLYAEAKLNDSKILAEEKTLIAAGGGVIDDQTLASIRDRSFMAVAPEVGRLIYLLVRSRRPALIVEFGTSFGLSAIHLAAALRDNGFGRLITTEQSANKASRAWQHLTQEWRIGWKSDKATLSRHSPL